MQNSIKRYAVMVPLVILLCSGTALTLNALLVPLKAFAAPHLLEFAWDRSMVKGEAVKPWWWMDSAVAAKLSFPERDLSYVVLNGVSGTVLAFAPGKQESVSFSNPDLHLISAHRDTHFRFLQHVEIGEQIIMQNVQGAHHSYEVRDIFITDTPHMILSQDDQALYLVTCYPFDGWGKNPQQRYVVKAILNEGA